MKYQILRTETDLAGNLQVWVDLGNGRTEIFKFKQEPTESVIRETVDRYEQAIESLKQEIRTRFSKHLLNRDLLEYPEE